MEGVSVRVCTEHIPNSDNTIFGSITQQCAIALVLNNDTNMVKIPLAYMECDDYVRDTCQHLLETHSVADFDAAVKMSIQKILVRKDVLLKDAVSKALKIVSGYRTQLPAEKDQELVPGTMFPRPSNDCGTWARVPFEQLIQNTKPTSNNDINGDSYTIWRNLFKSGWSSCPFTFTVATKTIPAIYIYEKTSTLVIAGITPDRTHIYIATFGVAVHKDTLSAPWRELWIPIPTLTTVDTLQLSYLTTEQDDEEMYAVGFSHGVVIVKKNQCALHTIQHPDFTLETIGMISSVLLKSETELIMGTSLGCIWNVHPTETDIVNRFLVFPHMVPVRHMRQAKDTILALTVNNVQIIPDDADFIRTVDFVRPIDARIQDDHLFILGKYGRVCIFDLNEPDAAPLQIAPPTDRCSTQIAQPWYSALFVSPNKKLLNVLYPDGVCTGFKL